MSSAPAGRSVSHLTPRYIWHRAVQALGHRLHPGRPWLTAEAVGVLDGLLKRTIDGIEFGAGRSTPWFAGRLRRLVSVEHDARWHVMVSRNLRQRGIRNVNLKLVPVHQVAESGSGSRDAHRYCQAGFGRLKRPGFVLVDGLFRDICAMAAAKRLTTGGLLVLDNAERYLPAATASPGAGRRFMSPAWRKFSGLVRRWTVHWTSDGVSDTAIWIKPAGAP